MNRTFKVAKSLTRGVVVTSEKGFFLSGQGGEDRRCRCSGV
ncbi:MAG: hypothetical protein ACLT49_06500 [Sutterella wadsworthensis]